MRIKKSIKIKIDASHIQAAEINEILEDEKCQAELLEKLKAYRILEQCVKVK